MEAIIRDRAYTLAEVGVILGVRESAVRTMIRKGRLKASRPGKSYLVLGSFLLEMLSEPAEPRPRKVIPPVPDKQVGTGESGSPEPDRVSVVVVKERKRKRVA